MRILVCGDRDWDDYNHIFGALQGYKPTTVIEGEARGADSMARKAAQNLNIPVLKFPAQWRLYGKAAGPKRNQQMLDEGKPDMVFAFHNDLDNSKGTKDMVKRAIRSGVPVVHFTKTSMRRLD